MAWYTSWIPGLPSFNFAIPTSIQGHFISFILKKSLGHLLKPGQLDYHQIDSQIGSGYVQVNDLELNSEAINGYLSGFPITLQEGTISSVKVRIPWPNPLASTLGFTLKSLHLVFLVTPAIHNPHTSETDLSESVASVAESFVHDELSSREDVAIWQSFNQEVSTHPNYDENHALPGGLDMSDINNDPHKFDMDPAGVSVFAGLIERLLARFEFDAQDIKVTLVHPGNMSLTLSLHEIKYYTDAMEASTPSSSGEPSIPGENRTLTIVGMSVSASNLSTVLVNPPFRSVTQGYREGPSNMSSSQPQSPTSSNSSIDEETNFAMSQSLAFLPPRPLSPASSVSSSMYESAISTTSSAVAIHDITELLQPEIPPTLGHTNVGKPMDESPAERDEEMLKFGNQPISLFLTTHSSLPQTSDEDPFLPTTDSTTSWKDDLQLTLSIGVVACVIRPWQVQALLRLSQAFTPVQYVSGATPSKTPSTTKLPPIKTSASMSAFVLLLLPSACDARDVVKEDPITDFFNRPLVPPQLQCGYTRIFLDSLSASLRYVEGPPLIDFEFGIGDISVFFFRRSSDMAHQTSELLAFPLLITDPNLISQYPRSHVHPQGDERYPNLPTFEVIEWSNEKCRAFGTKLSQWRCQPPKSNSPHVLSSQIALRVTGTRITTSDGGQIQTSDILKARLAPLNFRFDLELLTHPDGPLVFFEDLGINDNQISDQISVSSDATVEQLTAGWRTQVHQEKGREEPSVVRTGKGLSQQVKSCQHSEMTFYLPLIRLSVRCPPPPHLEKRSSSLIFDLHDVNISTGAKPRKPTARFANPDVYATMQTDIPEEDILLKTDFNRIIIACSIIGGNTATAFVSIGPLTESSDPTEFITYNELHPPLQPRISIIRPKTPKATPLLALSIDIPAVHCDITKSMFDGLQFWADDIRQFLEHLSDVEHEEVAESKDTSLIGSRFFAKSRAGSSLTNSTTESAETVVKLTVTEAFVRIMVPRSDHDRPASRPFDIKASDLDILVELNPDHKQTILTLGVMALTIDNVSTQGIIQRFLGPTSSQSLSAPKSIVKLRFSTSMIPETNTKETRIKLTLCGFLFCFFPNICWTADLAAFARNPPGTFESVIPSDRTRIFVKITDGSIRAFAPSHPGALVSYIKELEFSTDVVGDSRDSSFHILATELALLVIDNAQDQESYIDVTRPAHGVLNWTTAGYALLAEVADIDLNIINQLMSPPWWQVSIDRIVLRLHLCADTLTAVTAFSGDLGSLFKSSDEKPIQSNQGPTVVNPTRSDGTALMSSVEDLAFKRVPEIGPAPDMIYDDLPTNLDYLDESFGAAAGLRELVDEDLEEFDDGEIYMDNATDDPYIVSKIGGETIKIFDPQGLNLVEDFYLSIPPDKSQGTKHSSDAAFAIRVVDGHFNLFLYDGYDWSKTRKTIEEEVKGMRKRLAKIRQLVANGQIQDPTIEDTSAVLFNSVHIGLEDEEVFAEPSTLIAAIDEELKEDVEASSQSSWQSLRPTGSNKPRVRSTRIHGKRLTRSKAPSMEFCLSGLNAEFDQYSPDDPLVSRTFVTVKDLEILDHIKTSTWKKFLTELRSDSRGNVRETDSNMLRVELRGVRPVAGNSSEEVRLRAKLLPLRLYVDQDAVDFLKKFFSFKDPNVPLSTDTSDQGETYIQLGEIFPIDLKLDYKPRRVDYRALKEGRTIELMNFFHFDGAEMTLRHITLAGVTGWPRFFEMLNDLWTPDVKATQLVEVISGVAPIRSVVNVGSGVADLILLPIAQYKKDGRIVRGVQKGATAFVKSTAIEAIKMGAKLATGTQVILEQAEGILGGQFESPITTEPVQVSYGDDLGFENDEEDETADLISKYAQQPSDLKEGVQSAYKSLQKNLSSAAQTILAVPMEVYERSGNEGPVRSVIRAVPIAVLKPMIGASEAVSKTLLGLHNTLDPNVRHENDAKYKLR